MTETDRERQVLRDALDEGHRATRDRTPPFELLWSRAAAEMRPPRPAHRSRVALAAVALVITLATALAWWIADRQHPGDLEQAMTAAAVLGEWRAPLDFLLETPGREWLEAAPRWSLDTAAELRLAAPDLIEPEPQRPNTQMPNTQMPNT